MTTYLKLKMLINLSICCFICLEITWSFQDITETILKCWRLCYPYEKHIFKNLSSSTSHKKNYETLKLRDFSFFLSSTFICKPILIKISLNANIKKTQFFHKLKYDLKGHYRSHKVILKFQNDLFRRYLKTKICQECQHCADTNFS